MDFDFVDSGNGPVLLFLPGSYSTHAVWKGIKKELGSSYRTIATSLPGYGGSKEVRADAADDIPLMAGFVSNIVEFIGEPVHIIGHSFGGLIALATILRKNVDILSLVTFEANAVYSRKSGGEFSWKSDLDRMYQIFEDAYMSGDPDAAGIIIDYWSRSGTFRSLPLQVQDYCRATVSTNFLDWRTAQQNTPHLTDYETMQIPCTFAAGEYANPAITEITTELARHVPSSELRTVSGADHSLISTHPLECAEIIDEHLTNYYSKTN